ncbi:MAG: hypothetical protein ACFFCW_38525, partial [Candidatus Hodarchaeota archaeon]
MYSMGDLWNGYRPIPYGNEQTYTARFDVGEGAFNTCVRIRQTDYLACRRCSDLHDDLERICLGLTGQGGGRFFINEYRQVVKPHVSGDGRCYFVGEYPDAHFTFDVDGEEIDNSDDSNLDIGDPWPYQAVGVRYQFNAGRRDIYMKIEIDKETMYLLYLRGDLGINCQYLMDTLGRARNYKSGRFYVNEHGLIFTPVEVRWGEWEDIYVGR